MQRALYVTSSTVASAASSKLSWGRSWNQRETDVTSMKWILKAWGGWWWEDGHRDLTGEFLTCPHQLLQILPFTKMSFQKPSSKFARRLLRNDMARIGDERFQKPKQTSANPCPAFTVTWQQAPPTPDVRWGSSQQIDTHPRPGRPGQGRGPPTRPHRPPPPGCACTWRRHGSRTGRLSAKIALPLATAVTWRAIGWKAEQSTDKRALAAFNNPQHQCAEVIWKLMKQSLSVFWSSGPMHGIPQRSIRSKKVKIYR